MAIAVTLAFTACNSSDSGSAPVKGINKPWANVSPPTEQFSFNAETGDTIELANGTTIRIPAGILVDSKGAHVNGEVVLDFSTMYTSAEIIASGIPMDYDSAGSNYIFQSAGMFDINAHQGNEQLAIENGKSISMDFATTRQDETYCFYRYDTTASQWGYMNVPEVDTNPVRQALEEKIAGEAAAEPVKPEEYQPGTPVIDLDFDLQKHPELAGYNGIIWQYAGQGADPEANEWIYSQQWSDASLKLNDREQGIYALDLKNADKSFSTFMRPVLKGDDYQKALEEFTTRMSTWETEEQARRAEAEKVKDVPGYVSHLNVLVFGIHNMDCLRHNPDFIFANVKAKFEDAAFSDRAGVTFYVVSGNNDMTVGYNMLSATQCYYKKGVKNKVVAVHHATGKTWVMNSNDFAVTNKDGAMSISITLKPSQEKIDDVAGLETVLSKL